MWLVTFSRTTIAQSLLDVLPVQVVTKGHDNMVTVDQFNSAQAAQAERGASGAAVKASGHKAFAKFRKCHFHFQISVKKKKKNFVSTLHFAANERLHLLGQVGPVHPGRVFVAVTNGNADAFRAV